MPVIEAQRASILVPHDHRHINHESTRDHGQIMTFLYSVLSSLGLAFKLPLIARSTKMGNMRGRGYWRESDGESLTSEEAYDIWASYAYDILIGVSRSYHAVIEYGALAEEAQAASGVRTSVPFRHWIGKVLRRLVDRCHDEGVPPLTALVVKSTDGKVGDGYWAVLEVAGEPPVEDELQREYHAAAARLDCYRHFGAPLPLGGGVPALAPRLRVAVERRQGRVTVPPPTCPNCFVQLPATGICDSCGL